MFETVNQFFVEAVEYLRSAVSRDEEGQGMIEYGLLVALISIAAIATIALIGPQLKNMFQDVVNQL